MNNILCCKQCGSKPLDIDFGTSFEYGEKTFQIGDIGCSNNKCSTDVLITFDVDSVSKSTIERAAVAAWNIINNQD